MKTINDIKSYIVIAVFVAGLFGTWYDAKTDAALMEARVSQAEKEVAEIKKELEENSLELINYKLDEILKALSE